MIRIGILNNNIAASVAERKIQQLKDFEVSGSLTQEEYNKSQFAFESLLESSEALYLTKTEKTDCDFLKKILRRSTHIFLQQAFFPKLTELKELVSLQNEAECTVQIFNPYLFNSEILKISANLDTPRLTEINTHLANKSELELELLNSILFLAKTDTSGFRKMDVFALQGDTNFVINLHLQFVSGSVTQLTVHVGKNEKPSTNLTFYQKKESPITTKIPRTENIAGDSVKNALIEFSKAHAKNDATILSFNELQLALLSLQEVKEKLKYPNISLSV